MDYTIAQSWKKTKQNNKTKRNAIYTRTYKKNDNKTSMNTTVAN